MEVVSCSFIVLQNSGSKKDRPSLKYVGELIEEASIARWGSLSIGSGCHLDFWIGGSLVKKSQKSYDVSSDTEVGNE